MVALREVAASYERGHPVHVVAGNASWYGRGRACFTRTSTVYERVIDLYQYQHTRLIGDYVGARDGTESAPP